VFIVSVNTCPCCYTFFPYESPTPAGSAMQNMFGWDTDFVSRALMVHGLADQARNHILDYLFMIHRYGYMPNANAVVYLTRSEPPLIADTIWQYFLLTRDRDLLHLAYPRLKRNYQDYWNAPHHQTPVGLATNRDLGDHSLAPRLAAEAETGLDWTPIYGGDVRRRVPLITNCALVRYANRLAQIAREVGEEAESKAFSAAAAERSLRIRQYCWSETLGFFVEYDFMSARQIPCLSDCALWTLRAGVATQDQAATLVRSLGRIEQRFGLSCTDKGYPTPEPKVITAPPRPDCAWRRGNLECRTESRRRDGAAAMDVSRWLGAIACDRCRGARCLWL
jgi:alpha,alpha-trehalase